MQNGNSGGSGCLIAVLCVVGFLVFLVIIGGSCSSSSSSSSYSTRNNYSYGTRESYDAKYGQGSYDADKALLDSMRQEWNRQTGK